MPTTYPYGTKGAPTVGNGLGGLPRRPEPPSAPAVVAAPQPVGPYYLNRIAHRFNSADCFAYSPHVVASQTFSDGSFSDQLFYNIKAGTFHCTERTYSANQRQIKTTNGTATTWQINQDSTSTVRWIHCLKHDLTGMVTLNTQNQPPSRIENTACYETINGQDRFYFMTFDGTYMTLVEIRPNYATQPANASVWTQLTFNYVSVSRRPHGMFVKGDFVYVVCGGTSTSRMHLDTFNKSDFSFVSSVYWDVQGTPSTPSKGFYAETANTIAVRYQEASAAQQVRVFVLDKQTLKGYDYYNGIGGDSSWNSRLLNDSEEIYCVYGAGSGGGYGFAYVDVLRGDSIINVASQTYSGATFSLSQSVICTTPKGFNWGSYYQPGVSNGNSDFMQIFVPAPGKTFSYSAGSWNFSQSWSVNAITPTSGTFVSSTPPTASNQYTAQYSAFNPLGTTYITV